MARYTQNGHGQPCRCLLEVRDHKFIRQSRTTLTTHCHVLQSLHSFSPVVFLTEKWKGQVLGSIQGWKPAKWAGQKYGQMVSKWGTLTRVTEGVIRGSWPDREIKPRDLID